MSFNPRLFTEIRFGYNRFDETFWAAGQHL